jgi:hypothetical protein
VGTSVCHARLLVDGVAPYEKSPGARPGLLTKVAYVPPYADRVTSTTQPSETTTLRPQRPQGTATARSSSLPPPDRSVRRRPRHQIVVQLLPGSEPFLLVKGNGRDFRLPASASLDLLWSILEDGTTKLRKRHGEAIVRVRLSDAMRIPPLT